MTNIKHTIVVAVSALLISSAAVAQDNIAVTKHTSILAPTQGAALIIPRVRR